jgi:hypothetical protein
MPLPNSPAISLAARGSECEQGFFCLQGPRLRRDVDGRGHPPGVIPRTRRVHPGFQLGAGPDLQNVPHGLFSFLAEESPLRAAESAAAGIAEPVLDSGSRQDISLAHSDVWNFIAPERIAHRTLAHAEILGECPYARVRATTRRRFGLSH